MTPDQVLQASQLVARRERLTRHLEQVRKQPDVIGTLNDARFEAASGRPDLKTAYAAFVQDQLTQVIGEIDATLLDLGVGDPPAPKTWAVGLVTAAAVMINVEATTEEEAREKAPDIARGSDEWIINDELVEVTDVRG